MQRCLNFGQRSQPRSKTPQSERGVITFESRQFGSLTPFYRDDFRSQSFVFPKESSESDCGLISRSADCLRRQRADHRVRRIVRSF